MLVTFTDVSVKCGLSTVGRLKSAAYGIFVSALGHLEDLERHIDKLRASALNEFSVLKLS